ncbi:RNA ligase family protein [Paenarthrobacter sp. YJN-5]|uniref:RNA ligase family protein n=1 Tax=Paenarthrobacter sp. YJN-5 TaxID=2735316 RepID=UPI001D0C6ECD|nr:RNA ligase family protein [Paenarthrobacter sp. YJN-5]
METLEAVRALVTVETVTSLTPIENADFVAVARVRGWNLVVKKEEVSVGDAVVYFEIDSHLPLDDPRFAFLEPRGAKVYNGVRGHVLKSARMRGVYSQGLAIPARVFPELNELTSGEDLATVLGVTKYEEEIPEEMAGLASGAFPTRFAPKTGAERVQNLTDVFARLREEYDWFATEKVDGTSTTYINDGGVLRVAGRGWEYAAPASTAEATAPWKIAAEYDILNRLPVGYTVQGELYGSGVLAKNTLKETGKKFLAFNVLREGVFVPRSEWPAAIEEIGTPVLDLELPATVEEALAQVEGMKSVLNPAVMAEGIVWHNTAGARIPELQGRTGMKAINNKWLVKHS